MTSQRFGNSRRQLQFGIALALALLLIISAGALYGHYSQRWGPPIDLTAAAAKLALMPRHLGDWELQDELPMSKTALEQLECAGYVNRVYANARSGQQVNVAIIVGPGGPTAVHSPEICYSSRAYREKGPRERREIESSPVAKHCFWSVDFMATNPLAGDLRVYYAWSRDGLWEASDSPRYDYAGQSLLYKIQLASILPPSIKDLKSDDCHEFLEEFLRSGWKTMSSG